MILMDIRVDKLLTNDILYEIIAMGTPSVHTAIPRLVDRQRELTAFHK